MIWARNEFLQISQAVGFGVGVDQLGFDVWLSGLLARHLMGQVGGGERTGIREIVGLQITI